jgi:carbamate kinase
VGVDLRRVELSRHEVYPVDLGICVAHTQANMGYMICQCVDNELRKRQRHERTCTVITTVHVDQNDSAFTNPTKPIGQYYDKKAIDERVATHGWSVVEVPGRGFRRVVPSPKPKMIAELAVIRELFNKGHIVICCGGGGIPVIDPGNGMLEGVEAVIDKDLTAALLAVGTGADTLAILTDVERVRLNYGKPNEKPVGTLTISEARAHLSSGQFPPGSMGPKVQACVNYLEHTENPNAQALITSIEGCSDALAGRTGTRIVRDK